MLTAHGMPPIAVAQKRNRFCSLLLSKSGSSPFQVFALHLFHCLHQNNIALSPAAPWEEGFIVFFLCGGWGRMGAGGRYKAIPHNSKCRSGSCGTASALPKCSIMSGCGTRIVLRGQKPLALCDCCPCFGSLFPPLAALTFAASSIICAFGLASAAPRSPYRHLELCGIAFDNYS